MDDRLNADEIRRLHVRLALADGVGPIIFKRLMDCFGGAERVFSVSAAELRQAPGVGEKTAAAVLAVTDADVDREYDRAARRGVKVLCLADDEYPVALKNIHDPPPVLYVRGALEPADAIAIAIVGSRRCTHYGLEQAERFGGLLGRAGFSVISGGARGIDSAAHRGSLATGGRTISVMGCGLEKIYPPENAELFEQIVREGRGALVSALPMSIGVQSQNFPARNRLISGLSQGVLVIEAARRSGSLITANLAGEQGRILFALPGRVDSPFSQGANQLIRDGAVLVQDLDDILEHLGQLGELLADQPTSKPPAPPSPVLDETERKILDAFDGRAMAVDEIASAVSLPAHRVVAAMTLLAIKGLVVQRPGNMFECKNRG